MLMHRFPSASPMLPSDTAASVIVGMTPRPGAISRNKAASSCPHPKIAIPIGGTAEEDEDARDRVRRTAVRAGSLRIMLPFKAAGCCQHVCGFRYADDMPQRVASEHARADRRG